MSGDWFCRQQARPAPLRSWVTPPPQHILVCCLQAGEHAGFRHLLALHAFVVTGVERCMPPKDPAKLVRSLAPDWKVAGGCCRVAVACMAAAAAVRACMHACYACCLVGT